LPLNSRFAASLPTDGFALDSAEATGQGTDAYQVADEPPYRIFVQVTDLKEQVVRTVLVDRSKPNHVVAEWSEIWKRQKSKTEVSDDALVLASAHNALADRDDGEGAK